MEFEADTQAPHERVKPDAGEGGRALRITIRATDVRAARQAQESLAEAGFEAAALVGDRPAPEGADLIVIAGEDAPAAAMARALAAGELRPLSVLHARPERAPPQQGMESVAPFDGALALDGSPVLRARQIETALRMGAAEEERMRRRLTAVERGAALPRASEARMPRALYIGAPAPVFLPMERALAAHGGALTAAFTSYTGFDHLHDEAFDAVFLNGVSDTHTALSLCAAFRRNATLATLPTMMLARAGDRATIQQAAERGAAAIAEGPDGFSAALGWLFDAIRRERRRKAAVAELSALRDLMGDARTGLFTADAFAAHLARLADDHHATGRPLALAALRVIPAPGARRPPASVWKKGFGEIASLAARLIRDGDCGAALQGDTLALALPFTDLAGVRRCAARVASVAECTAFAAGDGGAAPLVFEQSVAELQPGESGAGLLARARAVFHEESARA